MSAATRHEYEQRIAAGADMLARTGAASFQVRYSDDEEPTVWFVVGEWKRDGRSVHETAAALEPLEALNRLLEKIMDGGTCTHCKKPTGFEPTDLGTMPLSELVCWTQYDPELRKYRRGCEEPSGG